MLFINAIKRFFSDSAPQLDWEIESDKPVTNPNLVRAAVLPPRRERSSVPVMRYTVVEGDDNQDDAIAQFVLNYPDKSFGLQKEVAYLKVVYPSRVVIAAVKVVHDGMSRTSAPQLFPLSADEMTQLCTKDGEIELHGYSMTEQDCGYINHLIWDKTP